MFSCAQALPEGTVSDEADRHIPDLKPKHLFFGMRCIGKTDRR